MDVSQGSELLLFGGLPATNDADLLQLASLLWATVFCQDCVGSNFTKDCTSLSCQRQSAIENHRTYWTYYKYLCKFYNPSDSDGEPMLQSHSDIRRIIAAIKQHPTLPKEKIIDSLRSSGNSPMGDANSALNIVASLMLMVNCSAQEESSLLLEAGVNRISWRPGSTLADYISLVLPKRQQSAPNSRQETILDSSWPLVTAKEMQRVLGTTFQGTNDITNHLRYDPINNILPVFRHVTYLKEHLALTQQCQGDLSVDDCIKLGALPRQYVLEVLHSTQKIVFPLWDDASYRLLQDLTSTSSLDKEVLNSGMDSRSSASATVPHLHSASSSIIRAGEEKIEFEYLGPRLLEIYHEMQHPRPRGDWAVWLERRSGSRYVMLATVCGVIFAIFLGMASLAVSSYQAHLAFQTWQHPVGPE